MLCLVNQSEIAANILIFLNGVSYREIRQVN